MIDLRFESMVIWPRRPTRDRDTGSKFKATYTQRVDMLETELTKLEATDTVIQIGLKREHIRNDGWPRTNAPAPEHPGIILSFRSNIHGDMRFMCDTYSDWKANLYAIAKMLERLRLLDIDGVGKDNEQYMGWKRIEASANSKDSRTTYGDAQPGIGVNYFEAQCHTNSPGELPMAAARYLSQFSAHSAFMINSHIQTLKLVYRDAVRKTHPDARGGGDAEKFIRVQQAYEILKNHHGI